MPGAWVTDDNDDALNVQLTLTQVQRLDRWIFHPARAQKTGDIDFEATLARFKSLFDSIVGRPAPTSATLAKMLATALLIAIGQRSSPVWLEAALVYRAFARFCGRMRCDGRRAERAFVRRLVAFQHAFMRCHMLALSDASQVLRRLQSPDSCARPYKSDVERDLRVYLSLPRPPSHVFVTEKWPGPNNAEWKDVSLMTWLYGRTYTLYAETMDEVQAAATGTAAEAAVLLFAQSLGVGAPALAADAVADAADEAARGGNAHGDAPTIEQQRAAAQQKLDRLMQHYADAVNTAKKGSKEAQGCKGSGSVLGYVGYVKERRASTNIMMEYFVNVVCQFPTFESSQYLPEGMRQVGLALLQLQMRLAGLIHRSQLSDIAHELYARLERHESVPETGPINSWMNEVARLYTRFECVCGPDAQAIQSAVDTGRV